MKLRSFLLRNSLLLLPAFLLLGALRLTAQTQAENTSSIAQAQVVPARITQIIDETQLVRLKGNVHPLARPEFDQGTVPDWQRVNRIWLLLRRSDEQETALRQLMEEQQTVGSANYHKWLTPQQFGAQFGPAEADIEAIKGWLSAKGFQNIQVSNGRTIIQFDGSAKLVREAFHTVLHHLSVGGEDHFANMDDPQIPAALAPAADGVIGLHNFRKKSFIHKLGTFRQDLTTGEIRPLFTYTDVNGTFYGVGPWDFAKIYSIPSGADGNGQSIAIVGRSNINIQDVIDFRHMFGLDVSFPPNNVQVILNGADPGLVPGDEGEADLDVEWSGAVAPAATIKFVASESTQTDGVDGVDASAMFIVDNNIAPVMSESFGICEAAAGSAGNQAQNALWQQAAAQGITVSVAAGDNGSAGCDPPPNNPNETAATQGIAVSGTASTPFNVAVGGTDFDQANNQSQFWALPPSGSQTTSPTQTSAKGYIPEIPWNNSCGATGLHGCDSVTSGAASLNIAAGSGGPSNCTVLSGTSCVSGYAKPSWQAGFGDAARDIPDVSLFASNGFNKSFYIFCESDSGDIAGTTGCNLTSFSTTSPFHDFQAVGGTSVSAQAFAAIMALVNQKTGQRQGNANVVLYNLARSETFASCNSSTLTLPNACVFNDVTKNANAVPCAGGSPNCSKATTGGFGVLATGTGTGQTAAFTAAPGYDMATGLGSINVTNMLTNWVAAAPGLTATATSLGASSPTISLNSPITFSGTVKPNSGTGTPTGEVALENAATGQAIASGFLSGGSFSIETTMVPAGSPTNVKAHYGGDATFGPSESSSVSVTVAKQNSQIQVSFVTFLPPNGTPSLSTSAQSVPYGSPYILRVDVAPNPNPNLSGPGCENLATAQVQFVCPTGSVSLFDGGVALKDFPTPGTPNAGNAATLNDRGFAEDQPIQLNAGTHNITASYSPDANSSYNAPNPNTSNALAVTITAAATTVQVTPSASIITSGQSVTLTAKVSSQSNSSLGPTGTIQFLNGTTSLGSSVSCQPAPATVSGNTFVGASCTATLTTTLSMLPPVLFPTAPRGIPSPIVVTFAALCLLVILLARKTEWDKKVYAYVGFALLVVTATIIAGCSGNSGGPPTRTLTITAKYSGDAAGNGDGLGNYAASSGSTTITVQ